VDDLTMWLRRRPAVNTVRTREGVEQRETGRTISSQVPKNVMRLVRGVFDDAIARELIATNPAKLVRVKAATSKNLDDDWLRADEIDLLLSCETIPENLRTAYACALGLALRQDDLRILRVEQVDLDATMRGEPDPHVKVQMGKTDRWHRVPVLPWLAPRLRAHLEALPKGCPWVFPSRSGQVYAAAYDFEWREKRDRQRDEVRLSALHRAGVERKIRFHDLRGTCATHLALGTWGRQWSLREIQSMLAHSDQRVTERYVRRALDELAQAARETLGGPKPRDTLGHGVPEADRVLLDDSRGGRARGRTEDHRCVKPGRGSMIPKGCGGCVPTRVPSGPGSDVAGAIVALAKTGTAVPTPLLEALATEVLERPEVQLALAVREGGPHAVRQALELIEQLGLGVAAAAEETG
jgi:integrase